MENLHSDMFKRNNWVIFNKFTNNKIKNNSWNNN